MYNQKISYDLQRQNYRMVTNQVKVNKIHKSESKVYCLRVHTWKSFGKKDKTFQSNIGWLSIPEHFISEKEVEVLSSNYFQTDDMYFTRVERYINRKKLPVLQAYLLSIAP